MSVWVFAYLGGVSGTPEPTSTGNDTSKLFNMHPLFMTLAVVRATAARAL
jgi:hypothetical protein